MRICVPIPGPTTEQSLHDFGLALDQGANMLELRLDLMKTFDLEKLISKAPLETIVTIRAKDEGGLWTGTEKERYALFNEAAECGATYIDIEAKHYEPKQFKKRKSKLILSYHDFNHMPPDLEVIFEKIMNKNPDIVKIAAMAKNYLDNATMLNFVRNAKDIIPVIGLCMGEKGILTRFLGPEYGNYLTFAALKGKATASGQPTVSELKSYESLKSIKFKQLNYSDLSLL